MRRHQIAFASPSDDRSNGTAGSVSTSGRASPVIPLINAPPQPDTHNHGAPRRSRMSSAQPTERTALLSESQAELSRSYTNARTPPPTSRPLSRVSSIANTLHAYRSHSRNLSNAREFLSPTYTRSGLRTPRLTRSMILGNSILDERAWYDQFTSTDWVHDSIADGYRVLDLKKHRGYRGRLWLIFDAAQGWILMAIIGCLTAAIAYLVDIAEAAVFDLKRGYCKTAWYHSMVKCCQDDDQCANWMDWSDIVYPSKPDNDLIDYPFFIIGCVIFAAVACFLTLMSKTVIPSHVASTLDENLGARRHSETEQPGESKQSPSTSVPEPPPPTVYYSAAGSGVAEVKVILSGFVLHGYLGFQTLLLKCPALIFSVASGMSLGKEGPYVHIAACIGNISCRLFTKYNLNDGKRREVISAAAASGVAVAFGSPLGGVLFSLEEVSYYFPPKTLFRTFFCCIAAALSLKFLNPYGTNKIVIFEVRYVSDWHAFELFNFALLGVFGGLAGAGFIKASRFWAKTFRRWKPIKSYPWIEVLIVAFLTGAISFWNRYARLAVTELLFEIASPCTPENNTGLCPSTKEEIPAMIGYLLAAFVMKAFLTTITFGIKVPAGIYVPSIVCGGLMGRAMGHLMQYITLNLPESWPLGYCAASGNMEQCVTPGVYALVAGGATMCGVTRLSVTLAVILFELTGSLDYVLPFAIGILCAKWTADYLEPASIYDLLIEMNSYPFMDNRHTPLFDTELKDITTRPRSERIIDVSISPYVKATELRTKLNILHNAGEFDSGFPIVREKALVGYIPAPDLEFALDRLEGPEDNTLCLMYASDITGQISATRHRRWFAVLDEDSILEASESEHEGNETDESDGDTLEVDFVPFVDPAPIALDIHSPMDLVYQCFSKLGLRYICVVEAGEYRGMVHKKLFVRFLKTNESQHS